MEKDTYWTPVIFRVFYGEVLAILIQDPGTNDPNTCSCYAHIGQHSSCDPLGVISFSRPATKEEYRDLAKDLERIGYKLSIRTRQSFERDLQVRRDKIKEIKHA